jgi:hypothetical protein
MFSKKYESVQLIMAVRTKIVKKVSHLFSPDFIFQNQESFIHLSPKPLFV